MPVPCANLCANGQAPRSRKLDAMPHPSLLIVDDDRGTRATFGTALTLAGVSVQTTNSGLNALVVVKARNFDLLRLDFRMPGMNARRQSGAFSTRGARCRWPYIEPYELSCTHMHDDVRFW